MKHIKALAIKLVSIFVILWAILGGIYGIEIGDIFLITVVFGLIEYIVGDMILLRYTNNTIGTIGDFGLALLIFWVMIGGLTPVDNPLTAALIASIAVAVFEYFFHKYVYLYVFNQESRKNEKSTKNLHYQTEASRELTDVKKKKD
jgi:hypothetical protein